MRKYSRTLTVTTRTPFVPHPPKEWRTQRRSVQVVAQTTLRLHACCIRPIKMTHPEDTHFVGAFSPSIQHSNSKANDSVTVIVTVTNPSLDTTLGMLPRKELESGWGYENINIRPAVYSIPVQWTLRFDLYCFKHRVRSTTMLETVKHGPSGVPITSILYEYRS